MKRSATDAAASVTAAEKRPKKPKTASAPAAAAAAAAATAAVVAAVEAAIEAVDGARARIEVGVEAVAATSTTAGKTKKKKKEEGGDAKVDTTEERAALSVRALALMERAAALMRRAAAGRAGGAGTAATGGRPTALEQMLAGGHAVPPLDTSADGLVRLQAVLWGAVQDSTQATRDYAATWTEDPATGELVAPPPPATADAAAADGTAPPPPALATLRDYYMDQLTRGFGEELDHLRQEDGFDATKLALLVDCLEHGVNIFARLEGPLLTAALAERGAGSGLQPAHAMIAP